MRWASAVVFIAAVVIGLVAFACSGGQPEATATFASKPSPTFEGSVVVEVQLKEWAVAPARASVPRGNVIIAAKNVGVLEHTLLIFKTDTPADKLPVAEAKVKEGAAGQKVAQIDATQLQPGRASSISLALEPGSYVFICNLQGHYQSGMRAGFDVL